MKRGKREKLGRRGTLDRIMALCREKRWPLRRYEKALRRHFNKPTYKSMYAVPIWIKQYVDLERRLRRAQRRAFRERIQRQVQQAVASGVLKKPRFCESCHRRTLVASLQAHHRDYRYPLRVIWLCQPCHVKAHGKRAVQRAAFYAQQRELGQPLDMQLSRLRRRYEEGHLSRRNYNEQRCMLQS